MNKCTNILHVFQERSPVKKVLRHDTQQNIHSSQTLLMCDRWSIVCFSCLMTFILASFRRLVIMCSMLPCFPCWQGDCQLCFMHMHYICKTLHIQEIVYVLLLHHFSVELHWLLLLLGLDCTFEKMDQVREKQERLARLHFDLDSQESKR